MDHRAGAWQLEADAFRTEDMALVAKSNAEQAAADAVAQELLRSLGVEVTESERAPSAPAVRADAGERDSAQAVEAEANASPSPRSSMTTASSEFVRVELPPSAFADKIEAQIAEPWDRQLEVVAALHTSGPVEAIPKRIEQYMRLRGEGWHLSVRAFRTQSAALAQQANELFTRAAALASAATPGDASRRAPGR